MNYLDRIDPTTLTLHAPAKINLFLEVAERLPNGYHTVDTVMAAVSLCDRVTLRRMPNQGAPHVTLTTDREELSGSDNLCCRAACRFFEEAHITDTALLITLEKRIPIAAGLAGGSTDAAAVLRGLNLLYAHPDGSPRFSDEALDSLAAKLGADVPFCLHGGLSRADGVGDMLHPLPLPHCFSDLHLVIAVPPAHKVSTPEAYGAIDLARADSPPTLRTSAALLSALSEAKLSQALLFNRFEDVMLLRHPRIGQLKERMTALGAAFTLMSGSGPSVYGIFDSQAAALTAEKALREEGIPAFACGFCGRY